MSTEQAHLSPRDHVTLEWIVEIRSDLETDAADPDLTAYYRTEVLAPPQTAESEVLEEAVEFVAKQLSRVTNTDGLRPAEGSPFLEAVHLDDALREYVPESLAIIEFSDDVAFERTVNGTEVPCKGRIIDVDIENGFELIVLASEIGGVSPVTPESTEDAICTVPVEAVTTHFPDDD